MTYHTALGANGYMHSLKQFAICFFHESSRTILNDSNISLHNHNYIHIAKTRRTDDEH